MVNNLMGIITGQAIIREHRIAVERGTGFNVPPPQLSLMSNNLGWLSFVNSAKHR